jgi:malic enzyme
MQPFVVLFQASPGDISSVSVSAPGAGEALMAVAQHLQAQGLSEAMVFAVFDEAHLAQLQQQMQDQKAQLGQKQAVQGG